MGYEVFLDTPETLGIRMQAADVFDEASWVVREMAGRCAVVNLGYFLHLFSYEKQVRVGVKGVRALRGKGAVLVGMHVQAGKGTDFVHPTGGEAVWRHDKESFERMWEEVGRVVGCELLMEVEEGEPFEKIEVDDRVWTGSDEVFQVRFCVTVA